MAFPDPTFSGLVELIGYANLVTEQLFVPVALISLWIICFLFLINRGYDMPECATAASFITIWPAVFFRLTTYQGAPLINDFYLYMAVTMLIVSAMYMYFTKP